VSYPNTSFPSVDERSICSSTKERKTIKIQEKENETHKRKENETLKKKRKSMNN